MPFAVRDSFDLLDKLRIVMEGNCYFIRVILTDRYYPI
jgi:hypothetical protein